jgi:MGS-like domain-containing protein
MLEWAEYNLDLLAGHELFATATTGHLLEEQLGLPVTCFRSGPYGGDQQIGARIAEGQVDLLVFFWDWSAPTDTSAPLVPGSRPPPSLPGRGSQPPAHWGTAGGKSAVALSTNLRATSVSRWSLLRA